jgi:hypothetical protein
VKIGGFREKVHPQLSGGELKRRFLGHIRLASEGWARKLFDPRSAGKSLKREKAEPQISLILLISRKKLEPPPSTTHSKSV